MEETAISPYTGGITAFEDAQRVASSLAKSSLVPTAYQGQNGLANCIVALEIASRMRMSPLLVMQNLDVIHGRPSWKSSFLIGLINSCGRFTPLRFQYSGQGDDRSCYATTSDKATGEVIDGPAITIKMAKAQGWYGRSGSKWPDMPDLMLSYRAAAFWSRLHAPELQMGFQTAEEVIDVEEVTVAQVPAVPTSEPAGPSVTPSGPPDIDVGPTDGDGAVTPADTIPAPVSNAPRNPDPEPAAAAHEPEPAVADGGTADQPESGPLSKEDATALINKFKALNRTNRDKAGAAYKAFLEEFGIPAGTPMTQALTTQAQAAFLNEQLS
jgi:hypothetical protein